jgi:hypothetical protein
MTLDTSWHPLSAPGRSCDFALNEDMTVHCYRCHQDVAFADIQVIDLRRVDRSVIALLECTSCAVQGLLILDSGPAAGPEERTALGAFEPFHDRG